MNAIASSRWLFFTAVVAGGALWAGFEALDTEPWDSLYGWLAMTGLGFIFGILGKENPLYWPLAIYLGAALAGLGSLAKSVFFYSGGGANFFFPLGLLFLVPFTLPALFGSVAGFGLRKALDKSFDADPQ